MHPQPSCPSCRQPMEAHRFTSNQGHTLELDICFACQGLWFDPRENLKLAPAAVVRERYSERAASAGRGVLAFRGRCTPIQVALDAG